MRGDGLSGERLCRDEQAGRGTRVQVGASVDGAGGSGWSETEEGMRESSPSLDLSAVPVCG